MPRFLRVSFLILLVGLSTRPGATMAQPFIVDDTGLAPDGALQVEAWHHPYASWLVPSAQVAPGFDVVGGLALLHDSPCGAERMAFDLQSKWQVRPMGRGWSTAAVAGGTAELPTDDFRTPDPFTAYAYVPVGLAVRDGHVVAYPNAGWSYTQGGVHEIIWGARADVHLSTQVTVVGEVYGVRTSTPGIQTGMQLRPGADWLELNATVSYDERSDARRTWLTLGFVALLEPRQ
jgi:hypothetical protein